MTDRDTDFPWTILLRRIAEGNCTPFLGAGVSSPPLPTARQLSCQLAAEWGYPLTDDDSLMNVSQYKATMGRDAVFPKEEIRRRFAELGTPDFDQPYEPHAVLAGLPIPLYLTTNYDGFMTAALQRVQRNVTQELCRWNSGLMRSQESFLATHAPSSAAPVVFHLHGHLGVPASMVLTEDDYLDYTVNVAGDDSATQPQEMVIPPRVQEALAATSLLFVGYGLKDWNLRLLLRALVARAESSQRRLSVSVQLHRHDSAVKPDRMNEALRFLDKYFDALQVTVFWGSAERFVKDLKDNWIDFNRH